MPIDFLASAHGGDLVGHSSFVLPSVAASGDNVQMIAFVQNVAADVTTPPAGWTERATVVGGVFPARYSMLDKFFAIGASPYADTVTSTGTDEWGGAQFAFGAAGGAFANAAVHAVTYGYSGAGAQVDPTISVTLPSSTTPGSVLIAYMSLNTDLSDPTSEGPVWPDGWTVLEDLPGSPIVGSASVAYHVCDGTETVVSGQWMHDSVYSQVIMVGEYQILTLCDFSATPRFGSIPLTVAFTDLSTGDPTTWAWDFGDGGTSTLQNPTHIYSTPGDYTVTLEVSGGEIGDCTEVKAGYITVGDTSTWDVYPATDPDGPRIAQITHASKRTIRVELNGAGKGMFTINRHAPEATAINFAKGNLVKTAFAELAPDYIFSFFIEDGDFDLLSSDEDGGEDLSFSGRGGLSYLDRARMWDAAYSTGLDLTDTWTEIWHSTAVHHPSGTWYDPADTSAVRVIDMLTRRLYKIDQAAPHAGHVLSGALFSHYAGGLSGDPADSTIYWALEAPWLSGSSAHSFIHKITKATNVIAASYDIGTNHWTAIKSDGTSLWLTNQTDDKIHKRSRSTGGSIASYSITYKGVAQTNPTGISVNGTQLAYWFEGHKRALIASTSAPGTITDAISTSSISSMGGDWTTETGQDFFYMDSFSAGTVWKYQITTAVPHDPVSGTWRLDEGTPGAILARLVAEWQASARPQHPIPDLTHVFDFVNDSDGNPWASNDGTLEFTAAVGDLGMATVLRLLPYGLTVQMDPNLVLGGYNSFGTDRSHGSFAAGKVRFEKAVNIADELKRSLSDRRVDTHMLAQGQGTLYATATDADLGYVREGFISTQLTDPAALAGTAAAELEHERSVSDSIALTPPWGDDELNGIYLPWIHYWVGDTVRVHTGVSDFDYDETNWVLYAITLDEQDNGTWRPIVELGAGYLTTVASSTGGGGSTSSAGGTGGSGSGGGTPSAGVTVKDTVTGDTAVGLTVQSEDWAVFAPASGVAEVILRPPALVDLSDVDATDIADTQAPVFDATSVTWIPGTGGGGTGIYINVLDYGAVGDDTTDDTAAIQAACDAATLGQTVFFPAGRYKITSAINVNTTIHFLGEGSPDSPASMIHQHTANTNGIVGAAPPYDMYFEDIWINGPTISGLSGNTSGTGITSSRNIHGLNLRVSGFFDGIYIGSGSYYSKQINGMFIFNDRYSVIVDAAANNSSFLNCRASFNGSRGYVFNGGGAGGEAHRIRGGAVENNGVGGIWYDGGGNEGGFSVSDVYFESNPTDILLGPGNAVHAPIIEGCIFTNVGSGYNIDIASGGPVTILSNHFLDTSARNVRQQAGVTRVLLINNTPGSFTLQSAAIVIDPGNTTAAAAFGTAAAGTSPYLARIDHGHALGGAVGGDLTGTLPNPSVAATHAGSTHVALSTAVPLVESGSGSAGSGAQASRNDHVHPAASGSGGGTIVMQSGTSSPPVPVWTSDGTDYVYSS